MSWLYYETLILQPDFSEEMSYGLEDERVTVDAQDGPSWGAWPGITDQTFSFTYKFTTAAQYRDLREFLNRHAGRAKAFYLPSWRKDFDLAVSVTGGSSTTSILVVGHWHSENVTEARPDTVGRRIFIVNHLGQYADYWVQGIIEHEGNDELQLDRVLANDLLAGGCIIGLVHLARFASDEIDISMVGAGLGQSSLSFRKVTHTKRKDEEFEVSGDEIETMKGIESLSLTDEDPIGGGGWLAHAVGPFIYGAPQEENYQSDWVAKLDHETQEVTLTGPTGAEQDMPLFDPIGTVYNITFCFGALSREVLAWQEATQVAIAWISGGNNLIRFDGYSPVAFNTFEIDSTVASGDSTVAVFYLKRGDAWIYCRTLAGSFATENRFFLSPMVPLFLSSARRFGNKIQIVGIDAWHRRAIWSSFDYVPPQPVQVIYVAMSDQGSGIYRAETTFAEMSDKMLVGFSEFISGAFASIRVEATSPDHPGARVGMLDTGAGTYTEVRVSGESFHPGPRVSFVDAANGSYVLQRIQKSYPEAGIKAGMKDQITGSYA